jgi:G3E family GTPase
MSPLPLTILGGYLGAGKTTLINRLLAEPHGRRLTILVNDFGAINIDAGLIAAHDGDTLSLTNGCACCQLRDDMIEQLNELAKAADPPDHIIVEASGAGEPARLAYLGYGIEGLQLETVMVAVDGETIDAKLKDKFVGKLVARQITQADFIVLTKTDLTDDAGAQANETVQAICDAPVIDARSQDLAPHLLTTSPIAAARSAHDAENPPQHEMADAIFDQLSFTSPHPLPRHPFEDILHQFKGLARAKGHIGTHRLQLVGPRYRLIEAEQRDAQLVFIAPKGACDFASLNAALQALCAHASSPHSGEDQDTS